MRRHLLALALIPALALAGCGGGDGEGGDGPRVAASVEDQLRYLDPGSSAVFAIDLRYEGRNWKHLRTVASRALRAFRDATPAEDRAGFPVNLTGALNMVAGYAGLSFDEDVKPLLDGYLVIGITQRPVPPLPADVQALRRKPRRELTTSEQDRIFEAQTEQEDASEPRMVVVYRTRGKGLRRVLEKVAEGDKPKPVKGHDDVVTVAGVGLVGDDTLLFTEGVGDRERTLRDALDRAEDGKGFPSARLADAEREAGLDDPFELVVADRTLARAWVEEPSLERATEEVPWIGAIRSIAGAVRLDEGGADVSAVVSTDPRGLEDDDLPVAPAGDLDLPRNEHITGASRDQSFTTTFLSRTARALFADSDFARAVERAERDLGVRFEDEVLRQFSCPSLSQFDPFSQRFGARSCVEDPERMRELLPKLSKHLPRILTTLQRLDTQGLVGLLLIAPDAPLTPSFTQLADIVVKPFGGGDDEETLYEVTGLRDDFGSELARSGPDRVVFGLVGDTFVVGSDVRMARAAAKLEGERLDEDAASAIRVPGSRFVDTGDDDSPEAKALTEVLKELRVTISADRSALRAKGRIDVEE